MLICSNKVWVSNGTLLSFEYILLVKSSRGAQELCISWFPRVYTDYQKYWRWILLKTVFQQAYYTTQASVTMAWQKRENLDKTI